MAFNREHTHFLVFFSVDKTVQVLLRQRITFVSDDEDDDQVSVNFKTSQLEDDGTETIQDQPYCGHVFFSGSASMCKSVMNQIIDEVDITGELERTLESLKTLARERQQSGKRGACLKLKRALEEECKDLPSKKSKPESKKKIKENKTEVGQKSKNTSKNIINEIKMKEIMAFAGVQQTTESSKEEMPTESCTMQSCSMESNPSKKPRLSISTDNTPKKAVFQLTRKSPSKVSQVSGAPGRNIKEKSPSKAVSDQTRNSPSKISRVTGSVGRNLNEKSPSKAVSDETRKSLSKISRISSATGRSHQEKSPGKAVSDQTKKSPSKISQVSSATGRSNQEKSPSKAVSNQTRKSPSKITQISGATVKNTKGQSPSKAVSDQTRKSPSKISRVSSATDKTYKEKSPSKAVSDQTRKSPSKISRVSSATDKTYKEKSPSKAVSNQTRKSPSKISRVSSATDRNLKEKSPSKAVSNQTRKSPSKITQISGATVKNTKGQSPSKTVSKKFLPESQDIGSALSSGLETINNYSCEEDFEVVEPLQNLESYESFSEHDASFEYGYNAYSYTAQLQQTVSINNIYGYFQSLDQAQKSTIMSFLNLLMQELASWSTGVQCPERMTASSRKTHITVPKENIEERKTPLVVDKDDASRFQTVLANPIKVRSAEMQAMVAKHPAKHLLNKVSDLVFTQQELKDAKGVKSLNRLKLDALKEYMYSKCESLQIEHLTPKNFTTTLQNKLGNVRAVYKKKVVLSSNVMAGSEYQTK